MSPDTTPLVISAIGTPAVHEGTGDGGIGTVEGTRTGKIVTITTPEGQRDVEVHLVRPVVAILVRAAWTFVTTFSGAVGANSLGAVEVSLQSAALIAGSAVLLGAAKDAAVVLNELKNKYPLLSGGI